MSLEARLKAEELYPSYLYPENVDARAALMQGYEAGYDAAKQACPSADLGEH